MIIKQKDLSKTTKLLWSLAVAIGLGFVILAALFLFFFVLNAISEGNLSQPGSIKGLLRIIPILIGPPLLVIFAMLRERVGGFLLTIVSLAGIIMVLIGAGAGKWVGFLLGGPFLISGVLFLLSYYSHKKR